MRDIRKTLHCTKQRVHHRSPLASIQFTTEQISLLAHQHITNQPLYIRVVYRHLRDVQVMGQFVIIANQVFQCLKNKTVVQSFRLSMISTLPRPHLFLVLTRKIGMPAVTEQYKII